MEVNKIVQLKDDYLLERLDGEITVYHPTLTTSVYLNETGALIWELCDGKRTVSAIIEILSEQYPESGDQINRDVQEVIEQLVDRDIAVLN